MVLFIFPPIFLENFDGIYKRPTGEKWIPVFPHETVIIKDWDKNGVFYNLDAVRFPNVRQIIMLSHPCEFNVLHRFPCATWITGPHYHRFFIDILNHTTFSEEEMTLLAHYLDVLPAVVSTKYDKKARCQFLK